MTGDIASIWTAFHKELKAYIQNKTRDHADTDDILQEVFIKISRDRDKVMAAKNVRAYIHGIVRNAVNDHFRRKKHHITSEIADVPLSEEHPEELNTIVADRCVRPFMDKLPDRYREALMLAEFEDISQKELAERLGISYSGAKSRVQRGREKLRELLVACCAYQSDSYGNLIAAEEKNCGCS